MDDHLQRVVDSLDVSPERLVNVIQCEVVSNNGVCRDLTRAHEGQRAAAVHPTLSTCCVDADVAPNREIHVHLHRAGVPGHDADATAALDVFQRLLHGGRTAGAFEDGVGTLALSYFTNTIGQI